MRTGRPKKEPIYVLAHGIAVISERRVRDRIYCSFEAHPFFPNSTPSASGRISVQRARVVMTAELGRALKTDEHVHHKNPRRKRDDSVENLELLTAADHNREHKLGTRHRRSVRKKIGESVRKAIAEGRAKRYRWFGEANPFYGKKHSAETRKKISRARRKAVR